MAEFSEEEKPVVCIKNLTFSYGGLDKNLPSYTGKLACDGLDCVIPPNSKVILVGANGAGKSTLLRVLTGVIHLGMEHDEFDINGNDKPQDQFNGVAYLGGVWKRRRTGFDGADPYSMDIAARDMMKAWQDANPERRDELVRVLGVNLDWRMHECSDGQRKKVRIMLKLLRPFRLCVIDEFAADLDIFSRKRFFDYLTAECAKRAASVVYATHIFDQADVWATHVAFMQLDKVLSPVHCLATYAPYQEILARTGAARSFCPMYDLVLEELERQYRAHSDCFTDDNQCLTDVIVAKECSEREDNAHEFALGTRDNSGYADGRLARELAIESMKEESKLSMTAKLKARAEALDEFRATYDASKKRLGDEHPDTLASAKMLGVVLHDKARILDEEGGSDPATLARLYTESADLLFPQFGEHKQIVRCRKRAAELLETDGERGALAAHAGLQTTA